MKKLFILLISLIIGNNLCAGIVIKSETTLMKDKNKLPETMHLSKDGFKIESKNKIFIYSSKEKTMYIIMNAEKKYLVLTNEDMKKQKQVMDKQVEMMQKSQKEQINKMKKHMKNMTPEQKKHTQQLIKQSEAQLASSKEATPVYKKTGKTSKHQKWKCQNFDILINGKKESSICTVSLKKLKITLDDYKVFSEIRKNMPSSSNANTQEFDQALVKMKKYGFPVIETNYDKNGKRNSIRKIKSVSRKKINSSLFTPPKNYQKISFEQMKQKQMQQQ